MRLIATAVVCVLAAFGAAFLIGRAANHQGSATAATAPARTSSSTTTTATTTSTTHTPDKALAAQFQPGLRGLRRKPTVHHRKHVVAAPATVPTPAAPVTTQSYTAPATTYTAPAYTPAPRTTAKPTHKSGGSGTTTIG
jgi:hypothetical protein